MFGPPQAWTTFSDVTGVLQDLLSTTNSKDVIDLPKRNKCILGVTSLWMIMPIAHGMVQWFQDGIGVGQKAVIAALSCSCLSSTMFWFDARRGSVFHKLDKLSAVQYVVCMVFVTALPGKSGRALSTGVGTFLPLSMISLFLLGDMCFKRSMYDLQLSLHLLFRYAGYWWGHLLLVPGENNFPAGFVILSVGYFGHIIGFNEVARRQGLFLTEDLYWSSCAILALWILVCGQVHSLVSCATDSPRQISLVQEVVIWLAYALGLLSSVISALQPHGMDPSRALHNYQTEALADKEKIDSMVASGLITSEEATVLKSDLDKRLLRRKDVFWKEQGVILLRQREVQEAGKDRAGQGE